MPRLFLCDCIPGDTIDDVFVMTGKQFSTTQGGKYFIKCFLADRTKQINARMWDATRDAFNCMPDPAGFIHIRGHVENYQNNLQLIIQQCYAPKEGSFDTSELIPHTEKNVDDMCRRMKEMLESIQNRHLAALVHAYLDDKQLMDRLCKAPAAMNFHHAYLGGLLEHTLNAIEVADAVCRFYPKLNRDLVIAGIFLHDIAKTWELTYDCAFAYSDGGQLVGHIVKSAIWVEEKRKVAEQILAEKIPQPLIDVIQHIILSHHGLPEFGSARTPSTPEAIAVHMIENLDAKLMMSLGATRGEVAEEAEGNWTEYMKQFGGRLYRPDPAPADVGEGEPLEEEINPAAMPQQPPQQLPQQQHHQPQPQDLSAKQPPDPTPPILKLRNPLFEVQHERKG
jgi:3'-5' exoribonuclease